MIEDISLRICQMGDKDWLFDLVRETMGDYIAQTYGQWDEEHHRARFEAAFDPNEWRIIVFGGKDAGMLQVEERPATFWISNIQIDPRLQRLGIGTTVIRSIIDDAERAGKSVTLRVFKVNPARGLYEKLGFEVSGENETHWYMEKKFPAPPWPTSDEERG